MHPFLKDTLELPRFEDVVNPIDAYVSIPNVAKHPNSVYPIAELFVVTLKL